MTLTDPHLMVDIETYSQQSNGLIRSIGAVLFDPTNGGFDNDYQFHIGIDVESSVLVGLHIEEETVKWWTAQKDNLARLRGLESTSIQSALYTFKYKYVGGKYDANKIKIWSHGSNFDTVLLANAYRAVGEKEWWNYKNIRDTRTLFDIAGYKYEAKGNHDALHDAINQATAVCDCYQQLMKRKEDHSFLAPKGIVNVNEEEKWKLSSEKKGG